MYSENTYSLNEMQTISLVNWNYKHSAIELPNCSTINPKLMGSRYVSLETFARFLHAVINFVLIIQKYACLSKSYSPNILILVYTAGVFFNE